MSLVYGRSVFSSLHSAKVWFPDIHQRSWVDWGIEVTERLVLVRVCLSGSPVHLHLSAPGPRGITDSLSLTSNRSLVIFPVEGCVLNARGQAKSIFLALHSGTWSNLDWINCWLTYCYLDYNQTWYTLTLSHAQLFTMYNVCGGRAMGPPLLGPLWTRA